jgi:hypothetical protein
VTGCEPRETHARRNAIKEILKPKPAEVTIEVAQRIAPKATLSLRAITEPDELRQVADLFWQYSD